MPSLYAKLASEGVPKTWVKSYALPQWWDDEDAADPSGFAHALGLIANHLGVEIRSLRDPKSRIECRRHCDPLYKKRKNVAVEDLKWARCIVERVTEIVAPATRLPPAEIPKAAATIRKQVMRESGDSCVTLTGLLAWLWARGLPVAHVSKLPPGAKKMDGLARFAGERPVIGIAKASRFDAILLFIIAHELGHISRGHVPRDQALIDVKVEKNEEDPQESEANAYAVELLTGAPDTRYDLGPVHPGLLARRAKEAGERDGVDPGVVLMNHAWVADEYVLTTCALKKLQPKGDARGAIQRAMLDELDLAQLHDEDRDFVVKVAAAGAADAVPAGQ